MTAFSVPGAMVKDDVTIVAQMADVVGNQWVRLVGTDASGNPVNVILTNGALDSTLATKLAGEDLTNDVLQVEQGKGLISYQAAAGSNWVIKATPGYLYGILCGAWVTNGVIQVSDHASSGSGAVKLKITMAGTNIDGFPKFIPVNANFLVGMTADQTGATQVTYIYR